MRTPSRQDKDYPASPIPQTAYQETGLHRGLTNKAGENNCFLNVTIQALWHLGPFRSHLQQLIAVLEEGKETLINFSSQNLDSGPNMSLLDSLCNMFIQYEFTDLNVLPPNELRDSLGKLSTDFELGKIADANEVLDAILQRIHLEFSAVCPNRARCLAHSTFGGVVLEQTICHLCGASSEPTIRTNFLLFFQAAEIIHEIDRIRPAVKLITHVHQEKRKNNFMRLFLSSKRSDENLNTEDEILKRNQFVAILRRCIMSIGKRSCPSKDESISPPKPKPAEQSDASSLDSDSKTSHNDSSRTASKAPVDCKGEGSVFFFSLDPPLILALSIGWTAATESRENLLKFYSVIPNTIALNSIFCDDLNDINRNSTPMWRHMPVNEPNQPIDLSDRRYSYLRESSASNRNATGPSYVFRGMVCYYGLHYVSIFLDTVTSNQEIYLLFDDQRVRPLGKWEEVVEHCITSLYQPVLLLYELEKQSAEFVTVRMKQNYSTLEVSDATAAAVVAVQPAAPTTTEEPTNLQEHDNHRTELPIVITMENENVKAVEPGLLDEEDEYEVVSSAVRAVRDKHPFLMNPNNSISFDTNETDKRLGKRLNYDTFKLDRFDVIEASKAISKQSTSRDQTNFTSSKDEEKPISKARINRSESKDVDERTANISIQEKATTASQSKTESKYSSLSQSKIKIWGRRPYRYQLTLPIITIQALSSNHFPSSVRRVVGLDLDINEFQDIIVVGFHKHPVTHDDLPAEQSKRINLLDQLIAVNGELLSSKFSTPSTNESKLNEVMKMIVSSSQNEQLVLLEFQSSFLTTLWFQCPQCYFVNELSLEKEARIKTEYQAKLSKAISIIPSQIGENEEITQTSRFQCFFTCKLCAVKSISEDYIPE